MSKQSQLLPALPYIGTMDLFDTGSFTVYYEEWSRTPKSYQLKNIDCENLDEAKQAVEYLKCVRMLEPVIRFLTGQEQLIVKDFGNQRRLQPVGACKKSFEKLLKQKNQTCQQVAEFFFNGGGKQYTNAMPGKKSKYWDRANRLLTEIRSFTRQHLAVENAVAA